jgi:hypothetical protein
MVGWRSPTERLRPFELASRDRSLLSSHRRFAESGKRIAFLQQSLFLGLGELLIIAPITPSRFPCGGIGGGCIGLAKSTDPRHGGAALLK